MSRNTEAFIRRLAANIEPVRPLPHVWIRTTVWLGLSVTYVAFVLLVMSPRHDVGSILKDSRFAIEQVSALAAGIAAAAVAFATVIPGHNRKLLILPLVPLLGWLGSLGPGCIEELGRVGPRGISFQHNLLCFPFIVLFGVLPAIAMAVMLRRGAPLTPRLTAALGGLAAAGLGNFSVRLVHPEDVSVMLLLWHVGGVLLLSVLAGGAGRYLLNWRSITGGAQNTAR
jgi:hypothetical protein